MKFPTAVAAAAALAFACQPVAVLAQATDPAQAPEPAQLPDAGQLLEEAVKPPQAPVQPARIDIRPGAAVLGDVLPAGATAVVRQVRVEGLEGLAPSQVLDRLEWTAGTSLDNMQVRALAAQVQAAVRAAGYPLAVASLPPQDLAQGVLRIAVAQGRWGPVRVSGGAAQAAQPWLQSLRAGEVITASQLERTLLTLGDLPGVTLRSVLRPGAAAGQGELEAQVDASPRVRGEAGYDNYGNHYAGNERLHANILVDSPLAFGDQFILQGSYSNLNTWLASATYSLPLGHQGLRGQVGLSRTDYELGKEAVKLQAHGTADVASAGLIQPLLRSATANVRLALAWQHKRLVDARDASATRWRSTASVVPLTLSADRVDPAGVTWGSLALGLGRLELDSALLAADRAGAQADGRFRKLNLDLSRLNHLGPQWSLYGRVSAQWASRNLGPSEKFILGGPGGVRAWPSGEGIGDEGWLAQLELRWRAGPLQPYAFFDAGGVRINHRPWQKSDNRRRIDGWGLGLRSSGPTWQLNLALAQHRAAGKSLAEPNASAARAWLTVGYRF